MALDVRLLEELQSRKDASADQVARRGPGNGGGGEPPRTTNTEERLRALQASNASIDKSLAVIIEQLKHVALREDVQSVRTEIAILTGKLDADMGSLGGKIDTQVATLSGKIDGMATAVDLAELKGRVARIPTVPVLVSVLLFISLLFTAAAWAIRHLPESWSRLIG